MSSKWKCPQCDSTDVEISIPAWFRESQDHNLTHVSNDEAAEPTAWYCHGCNDSGHGAPDRNDEAPPEVREDWGTYRVTFTVHTDAENISEAVRVAMGYVTDRSAWCEVDDARTEAVCGEERLAQGRIADVLEGKE